jgi:dihydrofolate reductase
MAVNSRTASHSGADESPVRPRVTLVVAVAENGVIGREGGLPWRLPADLQRFKALTLGKPVLMGRRTFESIGRALPGRHNIVLTRRRSDVAPLPGVTVVHDWEAALAAAGDAAEIMVIGGAEIYAMALPHADRIELTRVHATIDGDTHFPAIDAERWVTRHGETHAADERHPHAMTFLTLERAL